jgi:hypothetical protein
MPEYYVFPGDTITLEFAEEHIINIPHDGILRITRRSAPQRIHPNDLARGAYLRPDGRARFLDEPIDYIPPPPLPPSPWMHPDDLGARPRAARPRVARQVKPVPDPEDPYSMDA